MALQLPELSELSQWEVFTVLMCHPVYSQFVAVCLMLALLPVTVKAVAKFLEALFHRLREFELAISVDKGDCFVILWTRKNKNEYDVIRNLSSVEELSNTHFNR